MGYGLPSWGKIHIIFGLILIFIVIANNEYSGVSVISKFQSQRKVDFLHVGLYWWGKYSMELSSENKYNLDFYILQWLNQHRLMEIRKSYPDWNAILFRILSLEKGMDFKLGKLENWMQKFSKKTG